MMEITRNFLMIVRRVVVALSLKIQFRVININNRIVYHKKAFKAN